MEGRDEIRRIAETALRNIRQFTNGLAQIPTAQFNCHLKLLLVPITGIAVVLLGQITGKNENAVTELRRRFPTTAFSRCARLTPSSASSATRQKARCAGRPHASGHATKDIIVLRASEDRVPVKSEKAQVEREGLNYNYYKLLLVLILIDPGHMRNS